MTCYAMGLVMGLLWYGVFWCSVVWYGVCPTEVNINILGTEKKHFRLNMMAMGHAMAY